MKTKQQFDNERLFVEKSRIAFCLQQRENHAVMDISSITAVVGESDSNSSILVAYFLWLFFGFLGFHRFYCGRYKR